MSSCIVQSLTFFGCLGIMLAMIVSTLDNKPEPIKLDNDLDLDLVSKFTEIQVDEINKPVANRILEEINDFVKIYSHNVEYNSAQFKKLENIISTIKHTTLNDSFTSRDLHNTFEHLDKHASDSIWNKIKRDVLSPVIAMIDFTNYYCKVKRPRHFSSIGVLLTQLDNTTINFQLVKISADKYCNELDSTYKINMLKIEFDANPDYLGVYLIKPIV